MKFSLVQLHTLKFLALTLALVFAFGVATTTASAQANPQMNYQGKLTNASGVAVPDGTYNMRFWLVASSTAATSSAIWTESLTGSSRVQVTNGLFSVMLGSTTALTGVDFNQTLYLGVEVGGTGGSPTWDGEMSPRKVLGTVPAAFVATTAITASSANSLSGIASSSFLRSDEADTMTASSSSALLTVIQNGVGKVLSLFSGATEIFTALSNGNVGVGTSTPAAKFSVNGGSLADFFRAASTTATSTFAGGLIVGNNTLRVDGPAGTVSINTTAQDEELNVSGSIKATTGFYIGDMGGVNAFTAEYNRIFQAYDNTELAVYSGGTVGNRAGVTFQASSSPYTYFSNGGAETMRITASGNVGIGSSTPSHKLTVAGISQADIFLAASTTATSTFGEVNLAGISTNRDNWMFWGGQKFMYASSSSNGSLALGVNAFASATSAAPYNVAIGNRAMQNSTSTSFSTALGFSALQNSQGVSNTGVGSFSLSNTTSGYSNSALGANTLAANIVGHNNTAIGADALLNSTGNLNTAIGSSALYSYTSSGATAIGYRAGYGSTINTRSVSDSQATFIGYDASRDGSIASTTSLSNITALGYNAKVGCSNCLTLGGIGADAVNVGIGTSTPSARLSVNGLALADFFRAASTTATSSFGEVNFAALSPNRDNWMFWGGTKFINASSTGENLSMGLEAGAAITEGARNTAFGDDALSTLTTGVNNTAIGSGALTQGAVDGSNNVAVGHNSLAFSLGSRNVGLGALALYDADGSDNIGIGSEAMRNASGDNNIALGTEALTTTTVGTENVAIGNRSLFSNISGAYNTALGGQTLYYNRFATNTTAVGFQAGYGSSGNTASQNNLFLGYRSGYANTTGDNNTLVGYQTGDSLTTGDNNILIGYDIDAATAGTSNFLSIGNIIFGTSVDGTGTTLSSGNIGIGTTTPSQKLTVAGSGYFGGSLYLTGALLDSTAATGTLGMVLQSTGTSTRWVATSSLGISSGASTFLALTDTPSSYTANRVLFTNSGATAVTDSANFTFTGSLLQVVGGITANASSTIGGGTASTGLTVLGNATTTGDAYFAGNIGVGTDSPFAPVHVSNTSALVRVESTGAGQSSGLRLDGYDSNSNYRTAYLSLIPRDGVNQSQVEIADGSTSFFNVRMDGDVGIGTSTQEARLTVVNSGTQDAFVVASSSGTSLVTVSTVGNVGIGSSTPSSKLTIVGDTYIGGNLRLTGALLDSTAATGTLGMVLQSTGTSTRWVATSSLGISSGASTFLALTDTPSSYTANRLFFTNSGATGVTDDADLVFDGTNLGIGTTTPTQQLSVAGNALFRNLANSSSAFEVQKANGDYVLTIDTSTTQTLFGGATFAAGGIYGRNGDATSPTFAFTNDDDTGIFGSGGSNFLGFTTGGTERARITSGGNLGVGTSTPASRLTVVGASGSADAFTVASSTGTTMMTVRATGNVGIGTSTPQARLSVTNSGTGNAFVVASSSGKNLFRIRDNGFVDISLAGNPVPTFSSLLNVATDASGDVVNWGYNLSSSGDVFGSLGVEGGVTTYLRYANSDLSFYRGLSSTETMRLTSAGNVSIGTSTANSRLTVDGSLRLTGGLLDSTAATGTLGMVLQTTGTSTRWVATSTLGLGISGGTNGFLARWTSDTALGTGLFRDNGTVAGVNATSSSYTFNVQGTSGVNPFNVSSSTGTSLFTITNNGRVGIGSTTPSQALSVVGNSIVTGSATTSGNGYIAGRLTVGADAPSTGDVPIFEVAGSNPATRISNVGFGSFYTYLSSSGTGFSASGAGGHDNFRFYTGTNGDFIGANERLTIIGGTGNVGVGTSTPAALFGVAGLSLADYFRAASTTATSSFGEVNFAALSPGRDNWMFWGGSKFINASSTGENLSMGLGAGVAITAGERNTAFGDGALALNTTGSDNVAIGYGALSENVSGLHNVAIGSTALSNSDAYDNVAIGRAALVANIGGDENVAIGFNAFSHNTDGNSNIAIGRESGGDSFTDTSPDRRSVSDSYMTFIGYKSSRFEGVASTTGLSNGTAIGARARVGCSNCLTLGGIGSDAVKVGIGTSTPTAKLTIHAYGNETNTQLFTVASSTGGGVSTSTLFTILSSGNVGIGTTTPTSLLSVAGNTYIGGNLSLTGALLDSTAATGTLGMVLQSTGTSTRWVATSTLGISGGSSNWVDNGSYLSTLGSGDGIAVTGSSTILNLAMSSATTTDFYASRFINVAAGQPSQPSGYLYNGTTAYVASTSRSNFVLAQTEVVSAPTWSGTDNLAIMPYALGSNTTGELNIAIGTNALLTNSTGGFNTVVGQYAMQSSTAGDNVALGYLAGSDFSSPEYRSVLDTSVTFIGTASGRDGAVVASSTSLSNATALGANAKVGCSNCIALGGLGANAVRVGISTSSPFALGLTIDKSAITGTSTAGIGQYLAFANSSVGAQQFGNSTYIRTTNTATTTLVGAIMRLEDSTTYGNTLRGFEVQTERGTNTQGENTAISGFARTFGVRGVTEGDAGGTFEPAGVYGETRGTTQGNAIRGYSSSITTAALLKLFQDTSTFTGTGLLMNFGNSGGSFSSTTASRFIDLQNAGTTRFSVGAYGMLTIGSGTSNNAGIQIGYGGLCVDNDGSCNASTTGRISSVSTATGNSDLAEMYFSNDDLEPGEVVYLKGGLSVGRASESTKDLVIGVVSTLPGLIMGENDVSLRAGEEGHPIALKGRVPVKVSNENGPVTKGDELMLSGVPGVVMKASSTGTVVGIALEDYEETRAYSDTFINQFGESIIVPDYTPINRTSDPRINDGCYFGGGSEAGDAPCVPLVATTTEAQYDEADALALTEAKERALRALARESSDRVTTESGDEVRVGQIVMFVDLRYRYLDADGETMLAALRAQVGEEVTDTVWSRLVELADNFVDGVLSVFTLKADRVETNELCVDGVCVTADDLRTLLEGGDEVPIEPEPEEGPEEVVPDTDEDAPPGGEEAEGAGGEGEESLSEEGGGEAESPQEEIVTEETPPEEITEEENGGTEVTEEAVTEPEPEPEVTEEVVQSSEETNP